VATKITATAVTYGLTDCQPLVVEPPNRTMTDITRDFAWALTQVLGGVKEHDLTDQFGIPEDECAKVMSLLAQARAYLAQPEPEGPTDEELLAAQDQAVASFPPVHPEVKPLSAVEYARELEIRKARAVLARWGSQPSTVAQSGARWYDSTAPTGEP
jgi:hypothetical protein